MSEPTITGATAVIINAGQVLLHKRRDFRVWAVPGGRIEPDEAPGDAAIREVKEETGYDIAIDRLVGEYRRPQIPNGSGVVFLGRVVGCAAIQHGPETRAVKWFPVSALPFSLPRTHRLYILDAQAQTDQVVKRTIYLSKLEVFLIRSLRWLRNTVKAYL
jgi:ADP-ribose pyrophosphatase YjhB (NUDIX family)